MRDHDALALACRQEFETALAQLLAERYAQDNAVHAAVRYVLEGGGKRVRPVLSMLAAHAVSGRPSDALPAALAVEMVHTYSLVHDDLPCMDDDDLRRGKPTAHKVFGDAIALLAGDALLTDAFAVLTTSNSQVKKPVELVRELALAAGSDGMVLGQALDLYWTARAGAARSDLDRIHTLKTGRLHGAAAAMGALAVGAETGVAEALRDFGQLIGLAFQITDDLLDDTAATGKSRGKDKTAGKLTYLAQMRRSEAESAAQRCTDLAIQRVEHLKAEPLITFAKGLLRRDS